MFSFSFRKNSVTTVGLEFQSDGIAVASFSSLTKTPQVAFLQNDPKVEQRLALKDWVQANKFTKAITNVSLSANGYQLLLVEPPDVPKEELRDAIRWRLKDLLSMPLDQAVIDVFPLPGDGIRGNKKMVYVVALERNKVETIIETVRFAGLTLNAIDIPEMVIRNIVYFNLGEDLAERGIAVARLGEGSGSVFLYRHGNIYLARNFRLDYNAGLLDDLPEEALALELQRSVDYYERQMGQAPPSSVFVCGDHVVKGKIGAKLKSSFAAPVELLVPKFQVENDEANDVLVQQCLNALGAALRRDAA